MKMTKYIARVRQTIHRTKRFFVILVGQVVPLNQYWSHLRAITIKHRPNVFTSFCLQVRPRRANPVTRSNLICSKDISLSFSQSERSRKEKLKGHTLKRGLPLSSFNLVLYRKPLLKCHEGHAQKNV